MLDVRPLKTGIVLLATLAIAATPLQALSPNTPESIPSRHMAQSGRAIDSQVPDSVKQQYREDAAELALRLVMQRKSPSGNSVELPADLVQTLYNALIQVYRATDLPARNLVVDTYNIHTLPRPHTRELLVTVDPTQPWTRAWRDGKQLTGNAEIDALMKRFDLKLAKYFSSLNIASVQAGRPLNTPALAKLLTNIKGVRSAEASGSTDGSDIRAEFKGSYWQLDYILGFGDCPSGCTGRTTWRFNVYPNRSVKFAGRSGDAPPPPRKLATSGIEGRSTSSTMPGAIRRNPDGTQPRIEPLISPTPIPIAVLDRTGRKVTRIQPDKDGYFRVTLKPGTYTLVPEFQESKDVVLRNRDKLQNITVIEGQFATVNITYTVLAP